MRMCILVGYIVCVCVGGACLALAWCAVVAWNADVALVVALVLHYDI